MDDDLLAPPKRTLGKRQLYNLDLPPELRVNMDRAFAFVVNQEVPTGEKVNVAPWEQGIPIQDTQNPLDAGSRLGVLSDIQARSLDQKERMQELQ
jgi:hypothetical protein